MGALFGLLLLKFLLYVAAAQPFGGAEAAMCQWDCEWYVHTIQNGYDPEPRLWLGYNQANWAFFPLFPLLGRTLAAATGLGAFWSGTAVSALCFAGFAGLSTHYRALTRPRADQASWMVLLLVYPFSLYFFMAYTESLYLFLTVLLLISVQLQAHAGTGLVAGLLTAARPTGIVVIPYLAAEHAWRARAAFPPGLGVSQRMRIFADTLFPLALAPLGIACYMSYLYWLTGDALAFSHVQAAWSRRFTNPLTAVFEGLAQADWNLLLDPRAPQSDSYAASFALLAGLACLWLLARGLLLEAWLLGATVVLILIAGLASVPRYITANPVFLLVLGDVADRIRPRIMRVGLAAACVLLQGILLHQWFMRSSLLM